MSCMDVECRRSFEVNGKSFFAASRVYEEDVNGVPSQSDDSVLYNLNNPCVTDMLSAAQIQLLSSMKSGSHNDQGMEFSKVSWRYVCVCLCARRCMTFRPWNLVWYKVYTQPMFWTHRQT